MLLAYSEHLVSKFLIRIILTIVSTWFTLVSHSRLGHTVEYRFSELTASNRTVFHMDVSVNVSEKLKNFGISTFGSKLS